MVKKLYAGMMAMAMVLSSVPYYAFNNPVGIKVVQAEDNIESDINAIHYKYASGYNTLTEEQVRIIYTAIDEKVKEFDEYFTGADSVRVNDEEKLGLKIESIVLDDSVDLNDVSFVVEQYIKDNSKYWYLDNNIGITAQTSIDITELYTNISIAFGNNYQNLDDLKEMILNTHVLTTVPDTIGVDNTQEFLDAILKYVDTLVYNWSGKGPGGGFNYMTTEQVNTLSLAKFFAMCCNEYNIPNYVIPVTYNETKHLRRSNGELLSDGFTNSYGVILYDKDLDTYCFVDPFVDRLTNNSKIIKLKSLDYLKSKCYYDDNLVDSLISDSNTFIVADTPYGTHVDYYDTEEEPDDTPNVDEESGDTSSSVHYVDGQIVDDIIYDDENNTYTYNGVIYTRTIDPFFYENGEYLVVSGYTGNLPEDLVIPETIDDLRVKEIASRAFTNSKLKSVVIPSTVHDIDTGAFAYCPVLNTIVVESNIIGFNCLPDTDVPVSIFNDLDNNGKPVYNGIIYGYTNSNTQFFANDWGFKFDTILNYYNSDNRSDSVKHTVNGKEVNGVEFMPDEDISRGVYTYKGVMYNLDSDNLTVTGYTSDLPDNVEIAETIDGHRVTVIENAFVYSKMKSIVIPKTVTLIVPEALAFCSKLNTVVIENSNCDIMHSAIYNDYNDNGKLYFNGTIYGYKKSTAEDYAKLYGFKFDTILNYNPDNNDPTVTTTTVVDDPTASTTTTVTGSAIPVPDININLGDANGDGKTTLADAVAILQYLANADEYKIYDDCIVSADVVGNGDGINAEDALAIQLYILNVIDSFEDYADYIRK